MKNKIIIAISLFIIITAYISRVYYVNLHTYAPNEISYKMNTEVQIENDYFDSSSEIMNGYSVTVLDNEIIPVDEFQQQYHDYKNKMNAEYIYLVKARFRNVDNNLGDSAGIDLRHYILQEESYINFMDKEAYKLINGFNSIKFSLRYNSEIDIIIPFHVDAEYINVEKLCVGKPMLIVSLYPHKKIIELNWYIAERNEYVTLNGYT